MPQVLTAAVIEHRVQENMEEPRPAVRAEEVVKAERPVLIHLK